MVADLRCEFQDAAAKLVPLGTGKLSPDTKRAAMDENNGSRTIILHWPAWVTPQKHKR